MTDEPGTIGKVSMGEFHMQTDKPDYWQIVGIGLLTGILAVLFAVSYGTVIFAGPLADHVALGINIALFSSAVIGIVIAINSSHRGALAGVSDSSVILGLIAVEIQMVRPGADILPTFLVSIALASIGSGFLLWLLGRFRSGGLTRYIPYPVMGGFLAGIGWLMFKGSITSMTSLQLGIGELATLLEPDVIIKWAPGVVLGLLIFLIGPKRYTSAILAAMAAAFVLFWITALTLDVPIEKLRTDGWLLGPFRGGIPETQIDYLSTLPDPDWRAIFGEVPKFISIAVTTLIGLLLTAASLELTTRRDLNLNRELRAAGLANMLSGLGGGMIGFHYLSSTNLAYRMHGNHRLIGIISGLVCLAAIGIGATVFAFVPKILAGTLLVALGLAFLNTWLIQSYRRMQISDYGVLLLVFVIVVFVGFIEAIAVGLVVGGILFIVNYSRVEIIKMAVSGQSWSSNVERPEPEREVLRRDGDATFVLALQGFLFFGTANRLLRRVRKRLEESGRPPVKFVIVDFKWTRGLDSSIALTFKRLSQYAQDRNFSLCLTALQPGYLETLEREGLCQDRRTSQLAEKFEHDRRVVASDTDSEGGRFLIFPDLDHGLEWSEQRLLDTAGMDAEETVYSLNDLLADEFPEARLLERFLKCAHHVSFSVGDLVITEGSEGDNIFIIESGRVSVRIALDVGHDVRVKSLGPGNTVGEIALYCGGKRAASVIADQPTTAYVLTREDLDRLRHDEPEVVAAFHEYMARYLANRLDDTNRLVAAMAK